MCPRLVFSSGVFCKVSVQGVVALASSFATLSREVDFMKFSLRELSQITFALRGWWVVRKRVVYYIKSANLGRTWSENAKKCKRNL